MAADKPASLSFEHFAKGEDANVAVAAPKSSPLAPVHAKSSPYSSPTIPRDVLNYLPPDGSPFTLFGDPYAQQVFIPSETNVIRQSEYWYSGRNVDNDYPDKEIALLLFLGKHRVATRSQIMRAIFPPTASDTTVRDFLRRCTRKHGILVPFSWVSPCQDERTRPHIYGLSPKAAQAARDFNHQLFIPKQYQFIPVNYPVGQNPSMIGFFSTVIANEFYCKLFALDRVIDWSVGERVALQGSREFRIQYKMTLIRDVNDFRVLWIEVVRPQANWFDNCIRRLQDIQSAYSSLSRDNAPEAVILIVDHESRIEQISRLTEQFAPDVPIRFTTDELVINPESKALFYNYSDVDGLNPSNVRFLQKEWQGMTASAYFKTFKDDLSLLEDADY